MGTHQNRIGKWFGIKDVMQEKKVGRNDKMYLWIYPTSLSSVECDTRSIGLDSEFT